MYKYVYVYVCVYIYIGSRLGVPRSFQEPSVLSYYKSRYGIEMGGGGVGGCNNVMWTIVGLRVVETLRM